MCSIVEDEFEEEGAHFMVNDVDTLEPTLICRKCDSNNNANIKLPFKEAECEKCFLAGARHKFRATLGSSKILPKNSSATLVIDGSKQSIVLLDMFHHAQTQNTFKRLHCNAKILYIDENFSEVEKMRHIKEVKQILQCYPYELYYATIDGNEKPIKMDELTNICELSENMKMFVETLRELKSVSSQQDFILQSRKNVIRKVVKHIDCKFAFLSDISLDIATTLLTNISLGRGSSTMFDVSLIDDRTADVCVVRPLKDLTQLEIETYLKVQNLSYIERSDYKMLEGPNASIQNLTKDFISNLQNNFPSTVSTVFRVGDKIGKQARQKTDVKEDSVNSLSCTMCHSPLDYADSNTLFAIELSRVISKTADKSVCDISVLEEESKNALYNGVDGSNLLENFCHGCRNLQNDLPKSSIVSSRLKNNDVDT